MAIGEPGLSSGAAVRRRSATHDIFMGKGDRKGNHARNTYNSQMQLISNSLFPAFLEAIERIRLPNPQLGPLTVAEFRSSSGPTCVDNVGAVLQRFKDRYVSEIGQQPEYQVYFQDLPTTDFNMLIKLRNAAFLSTENSAEAIDYFAAAVPGTIYGRLFPYSTLHFAFTTFALNCLSRIPESVSDKNSLAYNGGQTGLHQSSVATMEAYSVQAREDLCKFLGARADEMADDGVLCLNFRCRDSDNSIPYSTPHEVVGDSIWDDFVEKGIISASLRDSFNPSHYWRSVQEVKEVLSEFSSEFQVYKQSVHQIHMPAGVHGATTAPLSDAVSPLSKGVPSLCRGLSSAMLRAHFGREVTNLYLERYAQVLREGIGSQTLSFYQPTTWLVLVLFRKPRSFDS